MRFAKVIVITLTPILGTGSVAAWEFTPGLPCVLTHETDDVKIRLTHDPTQPLYSITISKNTPWSGAPVFAMRFDGASPLVISTDRHTLNGDGHSVSVQDRGFGNVLNGMKFNDTATAVLGGTAVSFPLAGASGPVDAFRLCRAEPGV